MKKFAFLLTAAALAAGSAANAVVLVQKTATFTGVFGRGFDNNGYFFNNAPTSLVGQAFALKFNYAIEADGSVNEYSAYGSVDPHFISHSLTINGATYLQTNATRAAVIRIRTNDTSADFQQSFVTNNYGPTSDYDDFTGSGLAPTPLGSLLTNGNYVLSGGRFTLSATSRLNGVEAFGFYADTADGSLATLKISDFTAGIPEPATWTMLIVGFGLVGAMRRRQRRNTVTA